jgi:hypothetical protein
MLSQTQKGRTSSERKPPKTEASTSKPRAACRVSLKQDYWPTNSSKNASTNMDTGKANWYLDFGSMTQDPYSSHWLLMILASKKVGEEHAQHLKNALKEHNKLT